MARSHARVFTSIWGDEDFCALTAAAQRTYLLILSQPSLSWAGVAPYTMRRWAGLAADTKPAAITRAVTELAAARFVLVDTDTEEVWLRTFIRHDGVLTQPNVTKAMWNDYAAIQSEAIREAFRVEYPHLFDIPSPKGSGKGSDNPSAGPAGKGKRDSPTGSSPTPTPSSSSSPDPGASNRRGLTAVEEEAEVISLTTSLRGASA